MKPGPDQETSRPGSTDAVEDAVAFEARYVLARRREHRVACGALAGCLTGLGTVSAPVGGIGGGALFLLLGGWFVAILGFRADSWTFHAHPDGLQFTGAWRTTWISWDSVALVRAQSDNTTREEDIAVWLGDDEVPLVLPTSLVGFAEGERDELLRWIDESRDLASDPPRASRLAGERSE